MASIWRSGKLETLVGRDNRLQNSWDTRAQFWNRLDELRTRAEKKYTVFQMYKWRKWAKKNTAKTYGYFYRHRGAKRKNNFSLKYYDEYVQLVSYIIQSFK